MKYYPVTNLQVRLHLLESKSEGKKINTCHYSFLLQCLCFVQVVPDGVLQNLCNGNQCQRLVNDTYS